MFWVALFFGHFFVVWLSATAAIGTIGAFMLNSDKSNYLEVERQAFVAGMAVSLSFYICGMIWLVRTFL